MSSAPTHEWRATKAGPDLPSLPAGVAAGRIPHWHGERSVHRSCPVCGAESPQPVCRRPDQLWVHRCAECRMLYLADIPSPEDLGEFYRDYATYKQLPARRKARWRRLLGLKDADSYTRLLLQTGGVSGKRVCEVGCSSGSFLRMLREHGATVFGVDLDERALEHLRSEGIPGAKSLAPQPPCDVICALQLIEHLADPADFLAQVNASLVPDGRLLLALPNGGEADKAGPYWVGYRVDLEHLNYFSLATLSELLARRGFYVEHYWEYSQPSIPRGDAVVSWLRRRLGRRVANLVGLTEAEPRFDRGAFVLCLLARKVTQ